MTELDRGARRRGTVTAFDESAGLGTISSDEGVDHPFHCIEIADGSRSIDVGVQVSFDLLGKFGRWEAANIAT